MTFMWIHIISCPSYPAVSWHMATIIYIHVWLTIFMWYIWHIWRRWLRLQRLPRSWMMPDKKRPKTESPAANKRVKGEKKEEVFLVEMALKVWLLFHQAGDQKDNFNYDPVHFIRCPPSYGMVTFESWPLLLKSQIWSPHLAIRYDMITTSSY